MQEGSAYFTGAAPGGPDGPSRTASGAVGAVADAAADSAADAAAGREADLSRGALSGPAVASAPGGQDPPTLSTQQQLATLPHGPHLAHMHPHLFLTSPGVATGLERRATAFPGFGSPGKDAFQGPGAGGLGQDQARGGQPPAAGQAHQGQGQGAVALRSMGHALSAPVSQLGGWAAHVQQQQQQQQLDPQSPARDPAQMVSDWLMAHGYHSIIRRDELRIIEEIGRGAEGRYVYMWGFVLFPSWCF